MAMVICTDDHIVHRWIHAQPMGWTLMPHKNIISIYFPELLSKLLDVTISCIANKKYSRRTACYQSLSYPKWFDINALYYLFYACQHAIIDIYYFQFKYTYDRTSTKMLKVLLSVNFYVAFFNDIMHLLESQDQMDNVIQNQ